MNEQKCYTIKEIADELGVTKSAIQQKLTSKFRSKFVSKQLINGRTTLVINEEGYIQLKKNVNRKSSSKKKNDNVIAILQQQLQEKDEQIEKLQILLSQSQQLQLRQNEKIKQLEMQSKKHWWQKLFSKNVD